MNLPIENFGETTQVSITILVDNRTDLLVESTATVKRFVEEPLLAEHGFAALVDLKPNGARILMDLQMPVLDGLEATRRLRGETDPRIAGIPIIALTALAMPGDHERALAAGANEYMTKPVELAKLVDLIKQFIKDA